MQGMATLLPHPNISYWGLSVSSIKTKHCHHHTATTTTLTITTFYHAAYRLILLTMFCHIMQVLYLSKSRYFWRNFWLKINLTRKQKNLSHPVSLSPVKYLLANILDIDDKRNTSNKLI